MEIAHIDVFRAFPPEKRDGIHGLLGGAPRPRLLQSFEIGAGHSALESSMKVARLLAISRSPSPPHRGPSARGWCCSTPTRGCATALSPWIPVAATPRLRA